MLDYAHKVLERLRDMGVRLSEKENALLNGLNFEEGEKSFTQKELENWAVEGAILEEGELPPYLNKCVIIFEAGTGELLLALQSKEVTDVIKSLERHQIKELKRIGSLPRDNPEFRYETKLIKMLRILILADFKCNLSPHKSYEELLDISKQSLDGLAELKRNEIRLAEAQYDM
ncbi:hypothetical protein PCANC_15438 [Puccinia coronata f. sp. avenae]|uniref:Uncharacterized protein n=1 Tax=Puccinia coronata f. sp. avenae TaxID=200324 RepID=A0A2N5UHZ0_9BASI|nr:hypothetical protein PCANC_15438 [Puccinia coronata f. sp. avenae]